MECLPLLTLLKLSALRESANAPVIIGKESGRVLFSVKASAPFLELDLSHD